MSSDIQSRPVGRCFLCGTSGVLLYSNLTDPMFGTPGAWNVKRCPASGCGLLWLDPMPLDTEVLRAYDNYYTHETLPAQRPLSFRRRLLRQLDCSYLHGKYGYCEGIASGLKWAGAWRFLHPLKKAALDFGVLYLPARRGARLLEIGCGRGDTLQTLSDSGWISEGVDFDPRVVAAARARGLQVRLGSLAAQQFPEDYFDAVAMSHLIEHVHDPLALLSESRRIMKPGARIVLVTPNARSVMHGLFGSSWRSLDLPRHLYLFTPETLVALASRAGFTGVRTFTTVREADNVFLGSRSIRRTGRYLWGSPQPRLLKRTARLMALIEWMYLLFSPLNGEELVLFAEK